MSAAHSPKPLVGVVDDDAGQRHVLRRALEQAGYAVVEADDGVGGVELARTRPLSALLLDVRMPRMDGLEALRTIKAEHETLPVLLLTAYIDVRDAVAAMKSGAQDYLEKPVDLDEMLVALEEVAGLGHAAGALSCGHEELVLPPGVIAESPAMRALFREAARVAPTDVPVLLLGESGTGKEVLARYVHAQSARRERAFVAVNCAALPESLIESELFGHEKGAFTGAAAQKPGRFEEASGGTLLLDEIGEMPLALQPKLLRVLEEQTVRRVGGTRDLRVDVRLVAATNRPLEDDAREGRFREDLLYRLNVFPLRIAPLRQRREDILPLADFFLASQGMKQKRFAPAAQRLLVGYAWPGNVRELRNAVVRAAILARGSLIVAEDLPESLQSASSQEAPRLEGSLEEIEKSAIFEALRKSAGNKTHAARLLGISRRTLIYKLRSYGL